jgi:hypothetical protein
LDRVGQVRDERGGSVLELLASDLGAEVEIRIRHLCRRLVSRPGRPARHRRQGWGGKDCQECQCGRGKSASRKAQRTGRRLFRLVRHVDPKRRQVLNANIFVGGSSRVPVVQRAIAAKVGEEKIAKNVNADEAGLDRVGQVRDERGGSVLELLASDLGAEVEIVDEDS